MNRTDTKISIYLAALGAAASVLAGMALQSRLRVEIRGLTEDPAGQRAQDADDARAVPERITLTVSVGIILLVMALVTYTHLMAGDAPVAVEVTPQFEQLREQNGSYHLPIAIKNAGDQTAEDLRVELSVSLEGGDGESAEVTIQFLSGGEVANAVVVFRQVPTTDNFTARVISYLQPD
jgi:uncharacterized protein (TIGR02588 family)